MDGDDPLHGISSRLVRPVGSLRSVGYDAKPFVELAITSGHGIAKQPGGAARDLDRDGRRRTIAGRLPGPRPSGVMGDRRADEDRRILR
jgi:hypothetical protein